MGGRLDDGQLLARSRAGDQRAFEALIERHGRYLFGIARALVRLDHDAEDVVQETLLASLAARYDKKSSVRTWMVSILVRQAALLRRKRKRWSQERALPAREVQKDPVRAADARMDLVDLLERLSPEHREVIVMRELEQMSYDEMSQALQVPRGTVESRLYRAREQFRKMSG